VRLSHTFAASPLTDNCAAILGRAQHIVLGVSPGNFFSEERLAATIHWAGQRFESVSLLYPHVDMVVYTYLGRGYEPKHARERAHRDVRQVANRIHRACNADCASTVKPEVVRISDGFHTETYKKAREDITRAKAEHARFRDVCARMVEDVLRAGMPTGWEPTVEQLATGMEYLEIELPYFIDTPGILGVAESLFAYRLTPAFAPYLYCAEAPLPASKGQGFLTLESRE
jgi:cyclo(L-tyrosyl-L-tyrosyl) synthase